MHIHRNIGFRWTLLFSLVYLAQSTCGQQDKVPDPLRPWREWSMWSDRDRDCPALYNQADQRICFWPTQLEIATDRQGASWTLQVTTFAQTWVPLPGSHDLWPRNVRLSGQPIAVIEHHGRPCVLLTGGQHELSGKIPWKEAPEKLSVPPEIGILSLTVEGTRILQPAWDALGDVWLKRNQTTDTDKDALGVQIYRLLQDGIPLWLHTDIELTVSGKSREEDLGFLLPEGWRLSSIESLIPVAADATGRIKVQVRPGTWSINLRAFRTTDVSEVSFAADRRPPLELELIGFQAQPSFRSAELQGLNPVDVTQTTYPEKWRAFPVYAWETRRPFQLSERMRGMGIQRGAGLQIKRQGWLDEDGYGITFSDTLLGEKQSLLRLDVAEGQELGAVQIDGIRQLITRNPQTGQSGIELRMRNLNVQAITRSPQASKISANGWQIDADTLQLSVYLPPGWRMLACLGPDRVHGDWLTSWTLLDLFWLLVFSLAVLRLWGWIPGLIALLAFALTYHEPGSPRFAWLFLLMPVALLRVVPEGHARTLLQSWKYLAIAILLLRLVPFLAQQVQTLIYPQLERPRTVEVPIMSPAEEWNRPLEDLAQIPRALGRYIESDKYPQEGSVMSQKSSYFQTRNMMNDPKARVQTGPAQPEWSWNRVDCFWDGPVSASQRIQPFLVPRTIYRVIIAARLLLVLFMGAILIGVGRTVSISGQKIASQKIATLLIACLIVTATASPLPAQFPDPSLLETLRQRLLEPPDAFPHAADIAEARLTIEGNRVSMEAEIHAAVTTAVPLPGRLPFWSPLSLKLDGEPAETATRRQEYLWLVVPAGVHTVVVQGLLANTSDWEWSFLLKPRRVQAQAEGWTVTGIGPNGVPENEVLFQLIQAETGGDASYARREFDPILLVDRTLEIGLVWRVHTQVMRLSSTGRALALRIPLLPGENVLTSTATVSRGEIEVRFAPEESTFAWESELPIREMIELQARDTDQWVERWQLQASPMWHATSQGPPFILEEDAADLIPVWRPWPGERVQLRFSRPESVPGETLTVQRVMHETSLGRRQQTSLLQLHLESSLGGDFATELPAGALVTSVSRDGQALPLRQEGSRWILPVQPGKQTVEMRWRTESALPVVYRGEAISLAAKGNNVTTVIRVPESSWVLWADGPLRGPAVRFWGILAFALLVALILGSIKVSPLGRIAWMLLTLGLTQVHVVSALIVVAWFFAVAYRGRQTWESIPYWQFNALQLGLVVLTTLMLGILVAAIGEGLLGRPQMFILGNQSSHGFLQWYEPRMEVQLPQPRVISVSVWYYRLLMLAWALWIAASLLGWLRWGWEQFSRDGYWKKPSKLATVD